MVVHTEITTTVPTAAGSIIHGTLLNCDIIPALLEAVRVYAPAHYVAHLGAPFAPIPAHVQDEGDESDWWTSDDAYHLLEELVDALNDAAPDGLYFGAHVGDGSDFGFWPVDDLPDMMH